MQGDVEPNEEGMPSDVAGIIPRVLSRLFHRLEDEVSDYSVKISFLELYNEELRDLLASDVAVSQGEMQSMGSREFQEGCHGDGP